MLIDDASASTEPREENTSHLPKLLIDDPKFEIVAYHMFVKGHDKSRSL